MALPAAGVNSPNGRSREPISPERIASIAAAAVVLSLVVFLVVRNQPFRDPNLAALTRIVLSLAIAVFGATVPGFLNLSWSKFGATVRAGGALALFVLSFTETPSVLPLSSDPSRGEYDQGEHSYMSGHYDDAVAHLSNVPRGSPTYRLAVNLLGNSEFQLGNYSRALSDYEDALSASTDRRDQLEAKFNIGLTQMYAKNYEDAKKTLVPLLNTAEMGDDRAVIYNAASALFNLGEVGSAQAIFLKFPITAPVPSDTESRDLFAKAHWLTASLLLSKSPVDCDKINAEVATALAIDPILKDEIANDKKLAICTDVHGVKR